MLHRALVVLVVFTGLTVSPTLARAQGFALGPRFSFVRGSVASGTDSRFFGGTMRLQGSRHAVTELAMDYRAYLSDDLTTRVRETPFQGSLLLFPARGTFAPYVLAGIGVYTRMYDELDATGKITNTTRERKTGWHMGVGAEIRLSRHAALYGDYRLRFVKFGTPDAGSQTIDVPGFDKLKLSHQGSMWTSGVAFYF